ncbi:ParB/RepB/Spo0J family partition protein [Rhodanobacter soli]|uniref:ParB/RepB/Spo0J family partition protein n=1 Tax=Rhodanobacter soli TaxID=590609 RepID=UPI0031DA0772
MDVERVLQRLQAAEVQHLPLKALNTDEALQPREARMVPLREQMRVERRSEEHAGTLRLALEAAHTTELEPVFAADIGGALFVADGHHRLKAYRLAKRETIPARVLPMSHREAVLVSKLVNCAERALEMHPEQRRDAAWQYLAAVTHRGAKGLPTGESFRTVAGRFGIGKDTVQRMLRTLPKVNPKDHEGHLDPGTGWPRWPRVRRGPDGWTQDAEEMNVEQITRHNAEQFAKKYGALIDQFTVEEIRLGLQLHESEVLMDTVNEDAADFARETADADADY